LFYSGIALLNSLLLVIATFETNDFLIWFVVFETSTLTVISALTIEGRSYRRIFALVFLLVATFIGSAGVYSALSAGMRLDATSSVQISASSWMLSLLVSAIVLAKIPLFPFSLWLPEAHVEASWPGSVGLAAYALKFATIAVVIFFCSSSSGTYASSLDVLLCTVVVSVVFAVIAIGSTNDIKKVVANLSVLHMSATLSVLTSSTGISSENNGTFS
jgi:NADH:ubiquinone oxidoreductase subunit 4 (subunit M)